MGKNNKETSPATQLPAVTGAPADPEATAAAETGKAPVTEIPAPDISQPYKTVGRANALMKKKGGKGKNKDKKLVPKLIADGLNDQEIADVTGFTVDKVRELRQNPFGAKGPTEIKPHKAQLTPKSQLPKGYQHPISHPKDNEVVKPSKEAAAFEKEREDERKRTAYKPPGTTETDEKAKKKPRTRTRTSKSTKAKAKKK